MNLSYAFNFDMDGRTFIAADTPVPLDEERVAIKYRRVLFTAASRPFTLNPLKVMGAVL